MNYELSKIIERINLEIDDIYLPGAYDWIDENHNNAFSKAVDRLENVLANARKYSEDYVKHEAQFYLNTMLPLLRKYKNEKLKTKEDDFFSSVQKSLFEEGEI